MKKQIFTLLCACLMSGMLFAQSTWFNDKNLTLTGVYYYPEHWDESQWERDFKQMHDLGFEFTHFAEFARAQLEPEEGKYDFALAGQGNRFGRQVQTKSSDVYFYRYPTRLVKSQIS